jgi:hypothetical protein
LVLLAPKDLFPVCCLLCLHKSLGASKVNSILEISLWKQAKTTAYWK